MKKIFVLILTLSLILTLVPFSAAGAHDELQSKRVSITVAALNNGGMVYKGTSNWSYTDREIDRGTVLTLEAKEMGGTFLYWRDDTVNGKERILSFDTTYTFTVIDPVKISAVFLSEAHLTGKGYVTFSDVNGRIYLEQSVNAENSANSPVVSSIDNAGYSYVGWDSEAWKNVEEGEIYLIKTEYEKKDNTYSVAVEGGVAEPFKETYEYDDAIFITLDKGMIPQGKKFAGWSVNGKTVSFNENMSLRVGCDMEIEALYEEEESEKLPITAIIDADEEAASNGASFLTARYVPDGYELIESGILFASGSYTGDMLLDKVGVTKVKAYDDSKEGMFRYNKLIANGMSVRAVSYIIYEFEDALYVTYSDEVTIEK